MAVDGRKPVSFVFVANISARSVTRTCASSKRRRDPGYRRGAISTIAQKAARAAKIARLMMGLTTASAAPTR
jgi:hypothetical protein